MPKAADYPLPAALAYWVAPQRFSVTLTKLPRVAQGLFRGTSEHERQSFYSEFL